MRKILSASVVLALMSTTTLAQVGPPTFDGGRAYPADEQRIRLPGDAPQKKASRVAREQITPTPAGYSMSPLLGLGLGLGVVAVLAAAAGGGGDDDDTTPPDEDTDTPNEGWLRPGPGTEPDAGYRGEVVTIFDKISISTDRVLDVARSYQVADPDALSAVLSDERYLHNPALVSGDFANRIALGYTGAGVKVGVMDSGIVMSNENLANLRTGPGYAAFTGADMDRNRHGTQVTNILAGSSANHISRGVAPNVEVHDIMVIPQEGDDVKMSAGGYAGAYDYIIRQDLDIVNMSLTFDVGDGDLLKTSAVALRDQANGFRGATENGTIFVIASGNDGNVPTTNGLIGLGLNPDVGNDQVIAVYALNEDGETIADFSNTCGPAQNMCLGAVGVRVPVVRHEGNDSFFTGTSAATPVVSGALALLKEQHPELSAAEVVELVLFTATDAGRRGVDEIYGRGILNMDRAVLPVGGLRIVTGDTVSSQALSAQNAQIRVAPSAAGLLSGLDEISLVAVDDFNRGFEVSVSVLGRADLDEISPISPATARLSFSDGSRLTLSSEDGGFYEAEGWGLGYVTPDLVRDQNNHALTRGYEPLAHMGTGLWGGVSFGTVSANVHASEKDGGSWGAWLEGERAVAEGLSLRYAGGYASQEDAALGISLGEGRAKTGWMSLGGTYVMSENLSLAADLTASRTSYRGQGFVRDADLTASSARISLSHGDVWGGTLTGTIGTPLSVSDGQLRTDLPGDREISDGSTPTDGVMRRVSEINVSADRPVDFGISYAKDVGTRGRAEISAAHRKLSGGGGDTFFGAGLSFRF